MSSVTASKAARRQIADEFKSRKVPRGIFVVRCSATGEAWVGSSTNLSAAQNSLWFQLGTGGYRNTKLQTTWNRHCEAAFSFEVLEQFEDELSPLLINDFSVDGKKSWAKKLSAHLM